jgi:hypothetical protein
LDTAVAANRFGVVVVVVVEPPVAEPVWEALAPLLREEPVLEEPPGWIEPPEPLVTLPCLLVVLPVAGELPEPVVTLPLPLPVAEPAPPDPVEPLAELVLWLLSALVCAGVPEGAASA